MIGIGTQFELGNFLLKGRVNNTNSRLFTFSLLHKSEKCNVPSDILSEVY